MSTKKEILEYFKDINYAYNDSTRYDTLEMMLSELEGEKMGNEERCVICGEIIPEGRQVCPICEARAGLSTEWEKGQFPPDYIDRRNWDLTQGVDEIQLLKEKVEALTEIVHNPNFTFVVRCKNCIWWDKTEPLATIIPTPCRCRLRREKEGMCADDFCSRGNKKGNERQ